MKEIIAPIERGKIMAELTPERFLRHTNKGGNEIYVVNYKNAPYTMQEIGRLREIAFRSAGGGTGKEVDIDMFDTMEKPCQQLIVWDPDAKEILGGYRFILGGHAIRQRRPAYHRHFPHVRFLSEIHSGIYAAHHRIGPVIRFSRIPIDPIRSKRPFRPR